MANYQLSGVSYVYYKKFVSKDEYLKHYNGDLDYNKGLIDNAKIEFKDDNIFEVNCDELERDSLSFYLNFTSKRKEDNKLDKIPFGIYDLGFKQGSPMLFESSMSKHNTILPIHTELKELINKCDFSRKNNILLYGAPGNGKTQSVIDLANSINDLLVINVLDVDALRYLKYLPAEKKKILLFEEFTETMSKSDKKNVLNFLDGIDSIQNCISIMSTNYPKELESNIIDRPSRVRHFIEYKNPTESQIDIICKHFDVTPNFFYNKDYSVDNIINVIQTAKEDNMTIKDANTYITDKRKFLADTFKPSGGAMGIGSSSVEDDDI